MEQEGGQKDEETGEEMKKSISSRASELSYSCYDLSSLKSFSRSSSSFVVATTFSFILGALGCFYLSNEPLILFFFLFSLLSLLHSLWIEGNICHYVKLVFVCV